MSRRGRKAVRLPPELRQRIVALLEPLRQVRLADLCYWLQRDLHRIGLVNGQEHVRRFIVRLGWVSTGTCRGYVRGDDR